MRLLFKWRPLRCGFKMFMRRIKIKFLTTRAGLFKARLSKPRVSENFDFSFVNFCLDRLFVYVVCPSVLSCSYLKLQQTLEVKNIFKQENIMLQLALNPGLTLTGFRTTWPRCIAKGFTRQFDLFCYLLVFSSVNFGYTEGVCYKGS